MLVSFCFFFTDGRRLYAGWKRKGYLSLPMQKPSGQAKCWAHPGGLKKTLKKNLKKPRAGQGDNNTDTTEEEQLFDLA